MPDNNTPPEKPQLRTIYGGFSTGGPERIPSAMRPLTGAHGRPTIFSASTMDEARRKGEEPVVTEDGKVFAGKPLMGFSFSLSAIQRIEVLPVADETNKPGAVRITLKEPSATPGGAAYQDAIISELVKTIHKKGESHRDGNTIVLQPHEQKHVFDVLQSLLQVLTNKQVIRAGESHDAREAFNRIFAAQPGKRK